MDPPNVMGDPGAGPGEADLPCWLASLLFLLSDEGVPLIENGDERPESCRDCIGDWLGEWQPEAE